MLIKTSEPILDSGQNIIAEIAKFWDTISSGWQTIWGPHIHHGYYDAGINISPIEAQEKLLDKITQLLNIEKNNKILDVGCGLGGSTRYLAEKFDVEVTGISLSVTQINLANKQNTPELSKKIQYSIEDAHDLKRFQPNTFDIVWSLESCEQFYDKNKFIDESLRVLKPNGLLMIATWCSDQEYYRGDLAKKYLELCKNFQLPYMPSIEHYKQLLMKKGNLITVHDWSENVRQSWEIGIAHLKRISWFKLLTMGGIMGFQFVRKLKLMNHAFKTGQLRYGVFVLRNN